MNTKTNLPEATSSELHPILQQVACTELIERIGLAIIKDLKNLSCICKEYGTTLYVNTFPLGFRPSVALLNGDKNALFDVKGTYVGYGTDSSRLNLGFLAEPVVTFLQTYLNEHSYRYAPPHKTTGGTIFSTPEGIFWIDYTYTWFIRRRVD
jgi:hypothetical protein